MSSPHADPASNGQTFGKATVTVDIDAGDCVVHSFRPGPVFPIAQKTHLHSLDEVQGAYMVQYRLAPTDPMAADVARALKFAAQRLRADQVGKHNG
jgi:hypothetical protein